MSTLSTLPNASDPRGIFASEVRALMGRHNISGIRMAAELQIGQSEFSKRLRGATPFKFDEIARIAEFFNVSVGSLFGESTTGNGPGPRGGGSQSEGWEFESLRARKDRHLTAIAA